MAQSVHGMIDVFINEPDSFHQKSFGLRVSGRLTFRPVDMSEDESWLELEPTLNGGKTQPQRLEDGYYHFSVSFVDMETTHRGPETEGLALRNLPNFFSRGQCVVRDTPKPGSNSFQLYKREHETSSTGGARVTSWAKANSNAKLWWHAGRQRLGGPSLRHP